MANLKKNKLSSKISQLKQRNHRGVGKSDRKMEYQQYDLKAERYRIDYAGRTVACISSRQDSYERLFGENRQLAAERESVENAEIKSVMIEKK